MGSDDVDGYAGVDTPPSPVLSSSSARHTRKSSAESESSSLSKKLDHKVEHEEDREKENATRTETSQATIEDGEFILV